MFLKLIASVLGTLGAYALYEIFKAIYAELNSSARNLRGPKSAHWFYGNLKELLDDQASGLEERWFEQYGRTMKIHRLFVMITFAPSSLTRRPMFHKGVLVVEGDVHKQQRRILNPAFGAPQVRELTSIFVDTSIQLRDIWATQAAKAGGVARVEILSWLSKATLDIIGLAGFNYRINALGTESHEAPDELAEAFATVFASSSGSRALNMLKFLVPAIHYIPTREAKIVRKAQETMMRIGAKLLAAAKRETVENGTFSTGHGRDLLTLLVRANTSKDIPESQRLSDEAVIAQVPTFLVAGHETTSTAVTWALFALTQNMAVQTRLRKELLNVPTDHPTMDELNSLPYLECVVKETHRLYAPVPAVVRMATRDDIVPLGAPVTDTDGTVHESLRVRKGDQFRIPIAAVNRDAKIWGPDAMEFVPERWEAATPISNAIPGMWGNQLTFLGSSRGCIGFRFSLVETKALLFTLIRGFEFELAVPKEDIGKKGNAIVLRPIVLSDCAAGNQLPLLVRPV
ncbi:cytochrome P450, partial [Mycena rosella]